jgi:hypothetical protein
MAGREKDLIEARILLAAARGTEQERFDILIRSADEEEDEVLIEVARACFARASAAVDAIEAHIAKISPTLH